MSGRGKRLEKRNTQRIRIIWPEDKSNWIILFTPFLVGILTTWKFAVADFAMGGLLFFLCLLRTSLAAVLKNGVKDISGPAKTTIIVGTAHGLFLALILLLKYHLWLLLPIGALAAVLFVLESRRKPGDVREFLTIFLVTLSGPAAYYSSSGTLNAVAIVLWLLAAVYFSFTMIYSKGALRNPVRVRHSMRWLMTHAALFTTAVAVLFSLLRV